MKTNPNDSAFPVVTTEEINQGGLTKHEWFAGMALNGLCANNCGNQSEPIPGLAIHLADEIIRELNTKGIKE
jgi:hypothetical protein